MMGAFMLEGAIKTARQLSVSRVDLTLSCILVPAASGDARYGCRCTPTPTAAL